MANNHVIRTARLTDHQVLDLMFALNSKLDIVSNEFDLGLGDSMLFGSLTKDDESIEKLDRDAYCILNSTVQMKSGISIQFLRGICSNTEQFHIKRSPSPYYDEIALTSNDRSRYRSTLDEILQCMDIVQESLPKIYPLQQENQEQNVGDVLQGELTGLTNEYRKMATGLDTERAKFHQSVEEALQKLYAERKESRDALEAERQKLKEDHQAEMEKIKSEEIQRRQEFLDYEANQKSKLKKMKEELDEHKKSLDDRQYMHTRRGLRDQITKNYKERIGQAVVSSRAWWIQWLVFGLTLFAGLVAGYYSIESYQDLLNSDNASNDQWKMIGLSIRSATLTIAAVGFFFYAINWLKGIYIDHVRTDRKYESYGNDIDRASFVIETIMEVGEKENAKVPDTWISGVCRNLFTEKGNDSYDNVPSSVATMLLESISGAKFRTDGAEIEIDKRGARKLARRSKRSE